MPPGLSIDPTLCAKCGACSTVCPVYRATGREELTARGRLHLLGAMAGGHRSPAFVEIFSRCLLCGACRQACPRGIDLPAVVIETRHDLPRLTGAGSFRKYLATRCLARPALLAGLADLLELSCPVLRRLPAESGLRLKLGLFLDRQYDSGKERGEKPGLAMAESNDPNGIAIFTGCLARHLLPEVNRAASMLLTDTERERPAVPTGQSCCGLAAYSIGDRQEAVRLARRNLDAFAVAGGPIVTPCGSCYSHLQTYPDLLAEDPEYRHRALAFAGRLRELSSFLAERRETSKSDRTGSGAAKALRVFYHDPCHLRFQPGMREPPRRLLRAIPGLELVELPGGPRCCGLGGTFRISHPELSRRICSSLVEEIRALEPDLVLTSCSGCLLQLHGELARSGSLAEVRHLAAYLAAP